MNTTTTTGLLCSLILTAMAPCLSTTSSAVAPQRQVSGKGYPTLSPFTEMRPSGDTVDVRLGDDEWFELIAIDGMKATELVAGAHKACGERWWKRINEDLIELMDALDHPLEGRTVDLKLRTAAGKIVTREDVEMTHENRQLVREASRRYERQAAESSRLVDASAARADLGKLRDLVEQRFSYATLRDLDVNASFGPATWAHGPETVSSAAWSRTLTERLARFGDGHAGVGNRNTMFPGRCLPFLIAHAKGGFVAFKADRSGFVDSERPFVTAIDGVPIEEWLEQASRFVTSGSPQLVRRRSARLLRHLEFFRSLMDRAPSKQVVVSLTSPEGSSETRSLDLMAHKGAYGNWPVKPTSGYFAEDNIGYLRIARMSSDDEFLAGIDQVMAECRTKQAGGLIVDVRGNGGGSRQALRRFYPYLMAEAAEPKVANVAQYRLTPGEQSDTEVGHLENRYLWPATWPGWSAAASDAIAAFAKTFKPEWRAPEDSFTEPHYMVLERSSNPEAFHFEHPVVVLMDDGCFSATDIFLAALKGTDRVTLLGTASSGGSGRTQRYRLPGSGLEVGLSSMASFQPTGKLYDGNGVEPDVVLEPLPSDLIGTTDSLLDAARARLRQ